MRFKVAVSGYGAGSGSLLEVPLVETVTDSVTEPPVPVQVILNVVVLEIG